MGFNRDIYYLQWASHRSSLNAIVQPYSALVKSIFTISCVSGLSVNRTDRKGRRRLRQVSRAQSDLSHSLRAKVVHGLSASHAAEQSGPGAKCHQPVYCGDREISELHRDIRALRTG